MIHPNMQPAQMPVMSTFVPIPFEAMAKAGAVAQGRYDQAVDNQTKIGEALDEATGLTSTASFIDGIGSRQVDDQKYVDIEVSRLRDKLTALTKDHPNLLGSEYRTAASALLRDLKKSYSSEGTLGIAKQNIAEYQKILEEKSKNQDWQDDNSVAYRIEGALAQHANHPEGQIGKLSASEGYADYTDIGNEVESAVKSAEDRLISEGFTGYLTPEGYLQLATTKGKDKAYVTNLVKEELMNNPKTWSTIKRRAGMNILAGGENNYKKQIDAEVDRAVRKFLKLDTTRKYFKQDDDNSNGGSPFSNGDWSRDLKMGVSGLNSTYGIEDYEDMQTKVRNSANNIVSLQAKYASYLESNGITEENPKSKNVDGTVTDHSYAVFLFKNALENAKKENEKWKTIDSDLAKYAGFSYGDTQELIDEFGETLETSSLTTEQKEKINEDWREQLRQQISRGDTSGIRKWFADLVVAIEPNKTTSDAIGAGILKFFNNLDYKTELKVDRYNSRLKSDYGDYSTTVGVTTLPTKLTSNPAFKLESFAGDWESSAEILTTSGGHKDLDEDGMAELNISSNILQGYINDPNGKGIKLVYNVKKNDGSMVKVTTEPPKNFDLYLVEDGKADEFELQVETELYNETNRINRTAGKPSSITMGNPLDASSKAKFEELGYKVPEADPTTTLEIGIEASPVTGAEKWKVVVPLSNGKTKTKYFDFQSQAVSFAAETHRKNLAGYLSELKNTKVKK